ncbi:SID1 transmembrane family member 1-like [Ptychodera flava]|uniref:SID1 transmembrane family member 1-like n=1 Tax=Ptychodera flava TaxID=63121 RepID=UPI00396A1FC1
MKFPPVKPTYNQLDTLYQSTVTAGQMREYRFQVSGGVNKMVAVRVNVSSSNAQETYPVMFVVIQQKGVISWELPLEVASSFYNQRYDTIARTLCPMDFGDKEVSNLVIRVTCISPSDTAYRLIVSTINDFEIKLSANHTVIATPSQPQYYHFKFTDGIDAVQVQGHSKDKICATISVQKATCPVFDLLRSVEFIGKHQTLTTTSSIIVQKRDFTDFFIVLVVHPIDTECSELNQGVSIGEEAHNNL